MKLEEQIAADYLNSLGYGTAEYEPDGNVPPDFLFRPSIAIEVRRLNKNIEVLGRKEGLELTAIPLSKMIEATLRNLDGLWSGRTYFVFFQFKRPIPSKKALAVKLESFLRAFLHNPTFGPTKLSIDWALEIELIPATPINNQCFLIGGYDDIEEGGWLLEDLEANIQLCSDEKKIKIAPYRAKYQVWRLLLVDYIGYGLDEFARTQFRETVQIQHGWNKIVLISPLNSSHVFEI